ncbi:MAG: metallophosphoesterase [Woeseiaceae bacterium]
MIARSHYVIALALTLALVAGLTVIWPNPGWEPPVHMNIGAVDGETATFIAVGDFGTGGASQVDVARGMERVCERNGCDFVIGLGDNFYPDGLDSRSDKKFRTNFEEPFRGLNVPFFMVLGNHDVEEAESSRSQIAYSSDRWKLPGRWYSFQVGPVRFVALDTNPLSGDGDQLAWIKRTLSAPTGAAWTLAFGHHPLFSNGAHGDASGSNGEWLHAAICRSGGFDLYLAGHDHDLQWLAAQPESCKQTEFIVSGAGAIPRALETSENAAHFMRGQTLGFFWFEATASALTGRAYDAEGNELFERTIDVRPAETAVIGAP